MWIHNYVHIIYVNTVSCDPSCVNGVCVYPGACRCEEGWIDADCSRGKKHALEDVV